MESLPGYDDWKLQSGIEEPDDEPLVYDILKAKLESFEISTDGEDEYRVGSDDTFQCLRVTFGLLPRDNGEALEALEEQFKHCLAVVQAKIASRTKHTHK